jgi:hypothetical protein
VNERSRSLNAFAMSLVSLVCFLDGRRAVVRNGFLPEREVTSSP